MVILFKGFIDFSLFYSTLRLNSGFGAIFPTIVANPFPRNFRRWDFTNSSQAWQRGSVIFLVRLFSLLLNAAVDTHPEVRPSRRKKTRRSTADFYTCYLMLILRLMLTAGTRPQTSAEGAGAAFVP